MIYDIYLLEKDMYIDQTMSKSEFLSYLVRLSIFPGRWNDIIYDHESSTVKSLLQIQKTRHILKHLLCGCVACMCHLNLETSSICQ